METLSLTTKPSEILTSSCIACGKEIKTKTKYCSVKCSRELKKNLNKVIGNLMSYSVKAAVFSFNDTHIFLHLQKFNEKSLFHCFLQNRPISQNNKERLNTGESLLLLIRQLSRDYAEFSDTGSSAWNQIVKKYMTQTVEIVLPLPVKGWQRVPPTLRAEYESFQIEQNHILRMRDQKDLVRLIKRNYRQLAKQLHPDKNRNKSGSAFIKLKISYDKILDWVENPTDDHKIIGIKEGWLFLREYKKWYPPF